MRRPLLAILLLLLTSAALSHAQETAAGEAEQAGEKPAAASTPVEELEAKVEQGVQRKVTDEANAAFLRALWARFREVHERGDPAPDRRYGNRGRISVAKSYDEYVGRYNRRDAEGGGTFLEVTKSEDGRYLVHLEGHVIPAAPTNGALVFTTGDVVYASHLPKLDEEQFWALEWYEIVLLEEGFAMTDPSRAELSALEKEGEPAAGASAPAKAPAAANQDAARP